jgi:type VI secretion system secreted protein Hcp
VLEFFRPGTSGQEEQHYKIEFWNAFVSAIDFTMPNNRQPDLESRESFEIVAFVYQKIQWTWTDGSIVAQDDWYSPNS